VTRTLLGVSWICGALSTTGCKKDREAGPVRPAETQNAPPQPQTPDRLPPGELLEGPDRVFGFAIPRGMKLEAQFSGRADIVGTPSQQLVTDYVRQRVLVHHVQVEGTRYIFPQVRIRGAGTEIYRFEVRSDGGRTRIGIQHLVDREVPQELTDEERWKRAGMRPNGSLIDPQNLE
jgi:hypothetical protein